MSVTLPPTSAPAPFENVGVAPSLEARLVGQLRGREDLEAYRAAGGYAEGAERGGALIAAVEAAHLRGRGGAAFPTSVKWRSVAERPGPRYLLANGGEREPLSFKDRYLLGQRPHLVLEGLLLAAEAIGAEAAYVFVTESALERSVVTAVAELGSTAVPVLVHRADSGYAGAEETAAIRAIGGGPALPVAKPPRPYEQGLFGSPTLVQNVETLANVPTIAHNGWEAFQAVGTDGSPGTFLLSASGECGAPGLYEVPLGIELSAAFDAVAGGFAGTPKAFLVGGFFGGLLPAADHSVTLDYDELATRDSGLGCGAVHVVGPDRCPIGVAAEVMGYLAGESTGQCGPCVKGTAGMAETLTALIRGSADDEEIARLERWSTALPGRGACGLLDGAALLARSVLRNFGEEVARHLSHGCATCGTNDRAGGAIAKEVRSR